MRRPGINLRFALLALAQEKDDRRSYARLIRSTNRPSARCARSGPGSMIVIHLPSDSPFNEFVTRQLSRSIQVIDRAPDLPPPGHT